MLRLALAGALVCAASAASAAAPSAELQAQVEARPYVSGFCAPIAMNEADPAAFSQLLSSWEARAAAGGTGGDAMLQDITVPGQQFFFEGMDAPRAFVDRRKSGCSLLYRSATAPPLLTAEMQVVKLPVGEQNAMRPWRRISARRNGPPGPIRYFIAVGDSVTFGLCATILEDLRLRDNAPATLVKVATCRLGGDETFDNG